MFVAVSYPMTVVGTGVYANDCKHEPGGVPSLYSHSANFAHLAWSIKPQATLGQCGITLMELARRDFSLPVSLRPQSALGSPRSLLFAGAVA